MTEKEILIEKNKLPQNWDISPLDRISNVIMGQSPPSSTYNTDGNGLPFFQGKGEFGSLHPDVRKWCSKPSKIAKKNDVLISVRAPVGPTNLAPSECCIGRGLAAIHPAEGILTKYILFYLRSIESEIDALGTGTTFKAISGQILRNLPVPIAPPNEQTRIVSEIEKQFSRLNEAVAALKRIKANLKRYKASVLKAAVEGKLTEEWRKEHPDVEPASALLKRILAERRRKWEETNSKNKYKEPIAPDFTKLPCLPASWTGITLSTVINKVKRGPSMKCNRDGMGVRYITSGNLNNGKLRLDLDQKYLDNFTNIEKCELKPGDLILNCVNSLEQIGKSAVFHKQHGKAIVGFNNYALELNTDFISAEYANIFCESEIFKRQIYFLIKRAVNQVSFATRELDFICVPLPSANEQREMVLEVERLLSVTEEVDQELDLNLIRAERLRQSILKQAFSGKLVLRVIEAVT